MTKRTAAQPTPLDVSAFVEPNTDTPELRAYKEVLVGIFERYNLTNYLGGSIKELALPKDTPVKVKVTTSHPFEVTASVSASALDGKTLDEQKAVIAESIGEVQIFGQKRQMGSVKFPAESIVSMELLSVPTDKRWQRRVGARHSHVFLDPTAQGLQQSQCGKATWYTSDLTDETPNTQRCTVCH